MRFLIRLGAMLDAARHHKQFSLGQRDVALAEVNREMPAQDEKKSSVSSWRCQTNLPLTFTTSSL